MFFCKGVSTYETRAMNLIGEDKRIEKELKGKRLICELAFDRSDFDQWRSHLPQGFKAWNYSFVAAVMTVGVGVYEYEQGDYWHAFPWLTTPGHQNKWGKEFERFLDNHETLEGFRPLQELGHRFIAPILAHGGVPRYCLQDFFVLVTHNADYEQPSSDFIEFLKFHPSCLQNIDKPIQRFLRHGGEVAEEFVARVLALWQSRERGDGGGTYGLPKRVVDAFGDWYAAHGPVLQRRRRKRNRPRALLRIKPGDLGVYLYLPRCDDHPEIGKSAHWTALDRFWAVTSSHEIPLPLGDEWVVEIEGKRDILEGMTNSLPIIFFDRETGKVIPDPRHWRLPEHLWAIYRQTSKTTPPPCYSEPLPGWPEYGIAVFDLSGYKELRIGGHEFEVRRPFFQVSEDPNVRGCRTEKGLPVFFDVPGISWEGPANLTLVKDGNNQGSIDIEAHDLNMWFDEPGEYRFHLRGPLGQNVRKHFIFIPGLSFRTRPQVRWPTPERVCFEVLSDSVEFRSEKSQQPPFTSTDSQVYFRAVIGAKEFHLVAEVPSLMWRFIGADAEASEWTNKPLEINVQDVLQWDYPRFIFELADVEDNVNISLFGRHGAISPPPGHRSGISLQNIWAFDLREVREQVIQSGRAEEFDVLIQDNNGQHLYRGAVLSVRPQWDISDFQAKWKKEDEFYVIHVSWAGRGPLVADRWLVLIPLWRPWEGAFEVHQLSCHERSSFVWRFRKLQPGRYLIRAVHAPWGCEDWLNAQHVRQRLVDVDKENWREKFIQCEDEIASIEDYLECLLVHWYRPQLVKNPPLVPRGVAANHIRKFLWGLGRVNRMEKIKIPRDGSGALNLFCFNPQATTEAVSTAQPFPDIWEKILPSLDILTLKPSRQDKKFIHEVAFQYTVLPKAAPARYVKQKFKQRSLSLPLRSWHKNLTKTQPPADDVIFLCEKFGLFSDEGGPAVKREYENFKQSYIKREAV